MKETYTKLDDTRVLVKPTLELPPREENLDLVQDQIRQKEQELADLRAKEQTFINLGLKTKAQVVMENAQLQVNE